VKGVALLSSVRNIQKYSQSWHLAIVESFFYLQHDGLFDGKLLRTYTNAKMDIELQPHAVPVYRRPYSVPRVHMELFRKKLNRLVEIGVLERCGPSEWGLPTFIIPKKDGTKSAGSQTCGN
jgi:hypothetical protein